MKKRIYLVDVSSMFFRAFYAIRPLNSSKGVPVNAVYGFISMIIKLLKEKNPEYIVFCYDRKEPSFRKDLDQNYKANRTEMPDDMQVQMPYLKSVGRLLGIADIEVPSFEADDLIGTIAKQSEKENFEVFIVSGDKDFCQLVSNNVFLYDTMKEFVFTPDQVLEKHGVTPGQFIDYLAITGDTSDNIPGVSGIGPKGAIKLIQEFGNLEKIYENIDSVKPDGAKEKLIKSKDNAFLSKKLVTIVTDVKTDRELESYKRQEFLRDELRAFLQDLNFKSFEKTLLDEPGGFKSKSLANKESVNTFVPPVSNSAEVNFENAISDFSFEIKDWNQDILQKHIDDQKEFFTFVEGAEFCIGLKFEKYYSFFKTEISNVKIDFKNSKWSGFDLKKVWTQLGFKSSEISQFTIKNDVMLMAYTLRPADSSDIEKLAKVFLKKEFSEDLELSQKFRLMIEVESYVTNELNSKNLNAIYEKLEKPLIPILFQMEREGIKIDKELLKNFSEELKTKIESAESKIFEIAGEKFNVASPKQLGVVLFEKMGLEAIKKTKTGYSTDNEVLEKLNHPIAKQLIEFRELSKLKSTYVDSLPEQTDASDRVHTHFNQALTATGRLSSTDPNLQNIPIKTEVGQRVRFAFCAEKNKKLLSLDYSQIELRVLAHISDDKNLMKAFHDDLDIHTATASEIFSVGLKDVTSTQRRTAKAVNFGIAYGQGVFGLAETLGISRTESKDIIEKYFKKFSSIKTYIDSTIEKAHENKYVETLFGRRRYIAELESSNMMLKKFGERAAINAPIQGTASDLVKMAMIDIQKILPQTNLKMLLQVHDELIFEGAESDIEKSIPLIQRKMEKVAVLKVPLKVNYAVGNNWGEAH